LRGMRIKRTDGTKATPESIDAIVNAARAEGQRSENREQRSENRDQRTGIRDQGSGSSQPSALSLQLSAFSSQPVD
jgi:hypothetical protein